MEIEVERKHTDSNTYRKIRPHGNSMSHTSTTIVHMMQMVTGIHHCIYIVLFINMESILEGVVYSLSLSLSLSLEDTTVSELTAAPQFPKRSCVHLCPAQLNVPVPRNY